MVALTMVTLACGSAVPGVDPTSRSSSLAVSSRALPTHWYGVTLDDVSNVDAIADSFRPLWQTPIARIVFDPDKQPSDYRQAVQRLRPAAYLIGEPVDSHEVAASSVTGYVDRFRRYLADLGDQVDVWEVGNEVNGDWLGPSATVTAEITGAYDLVHAAGARTALTLYDNLGCTDDPSHNMWTWAENNLPQRMRDGLDYLLISYYEEDCHGLRPSIADWSSLFARLHTMFPGAELGFGEIGADRHDSVAVKVDYLKRYYTLPSLAPDYLGGYFWWYYAEDMIPYSGNPLWQAFDAAIP